MAVEREGRVTTQRGRTRSLHRLTEVRTLCQPNTFLSETEKLRPHPLGHQPAAQPGSPLSGSVTTPSPPFRCQSGSPLVRGRAGANQLRGQQEVGVGASPAAWRPPQQHLQRRGGAGCLRLRVAGRLSPAPGGVQRLLGSLPQPRTLQFQSTT